MNRLLDSHLHKDDMATLLNHKLSKTKVLKLLRARLVSVSSCTRPLLTI